MLTFDKVSFAYGDTPLLQDVSFVLPKTGTLCFTGPSGCGKTTLLRLIAGLEKPKSGIIRRPDNLKIAMVFQENRLLPWLTVWENVAAVCDDADTVREVLQAVALTDACRQYPHELSGGMQRRVALARAMAYGGDILILDEPFTGLDAELYRSIADHLRTRYAHKLILLVTHSDTEPTLFDATIHPLTAPLSGNLF